MSNASKQPRLRPFFHVTPPQGRLNDPNGMLLDGDTLHVFYQHDPAFPFGAKRTGWGHVSAPLRGDHALRWQHHPDALYPDADYDLNGCYSGGAVCDLDGSFKLFYTGNLKVDGKRRATQNMVTAENIGGAMGGVYRRLPENPLIDGPAAGYTAHYRDPMITRDPSGAYTWRMVLGAQREDETGAVVLYYSDDLYEWKFAGELEFDLETAVPGTSSDLVPGGYMWECPNLMQLRDQATGEELQLLIFCPQGLEASVDERGVTHYQSDDQCGYVVGKLEGTTFKVLRGFSELDVGHQFYAPQIIAEDEHANAAIMLGWMGLPAQDETLALEKEGWVHSLTLPRRLELHNHELRQSFVLPHSVQRRVSGGDVQVDLGAEFQKKACDVKHIRELSVGVIYLRKQLGGENFRWALRDTSGAEKLTIAYEPETSGLLKIERKGDVRATLCKRGQLEVFVDNNAIEILAADGAVAASIVVEPGENMVWDTQDL
ncbi:MAG: glycoside hydrolase family 32 protein [Corynebacterium sp.]|nr:glycoside hydrolase family 32 protein [Corynebacterium sp.]